MPSLRTTWMVGTGDSPTQVSMSEVDRINVESISERGPVRLRCQNKYPRFAFATLVIGLSLAHNAAASDATLELVPDFTGQLPLLLVLFALLMIPVNLLLIKPIFRALSDRDEQTTGKRGRAEKIMRGAEETLAEYERAVREVREEAERERKQRAASAREENAAVTAAARAEAEVELTRATGELAAALAQSRQGLRAEAESLAGEAATRVLGRAL
jgi:F-type H+-transporting ATPase subunit b